MIRLSAARLRDCIEVRLLTITEAGAELGVGRRTVLRHCRLHGVRTQRRGPRLGPRRRPAPT